MLARPEVVEWVSSMSANDEFSLRERSLVGSLLGSAVGDAIGLPFEGLSRRRARRWMRDPLGHQLLFGRGMVSDDTEHACMVAESLIAGGFEESVFARQLANRLRRWLLGVPAGVGFATLKSTLKLCVGISPERSGVFSAGSGPAMRAPILGVAFENLPALRSHVRRCTRITHTDPKAEYGALAIAAAAHLSARGRCDAEEYLATLRPFLKDDPARELIDLLTRAASSVAQRESTDDFASSLGLQRGVSGYMYHTVPVVVHAWLRHPSDFRAAIQTVVRCGGDTDTTAAIVGGIVGASVGKAGIPEEWLAALWEWPRSVDWIEQLGRHLSRQQAGESQRPPQLPVLATVSRNALFLLVVLTHGFRRLLPPY